MTIDKDKLIKIKNMGPLFIVGCQRSGTTMLYRILAETLNIGFGRDNTLFMTLSTNIKKYGDLNTKKNLKKLLEYIENNSVFKKRFVGMRINNDDFIECLVKREYGDIIRTIYAYWALLQGKTRWGGKTPDYTAHTKSLIKIFPDLKIIHIIRDGRDVATSFLQRRWGPKDPYIAAKYWKKRVDRGTAGRKLLGNKCLEIKYEDFLQFPREKFQEIIKFLNYYGIKKNQANIKFENIVSTINKKNIYKWKNKMNPRDVCVFEIIAGEKLENYGYEIVNKNFKELKLNFLQMTYHQINDVYERVKKGHIRRKFTRIGFKYDYK